MSTGKPSFKTRIGTVYRRSSSFLRDRDRDRDGSPRPGTPSVRSNSVDPMGSVSSSPRKGSMSSKPASIMEPETQPLALPTDGTGQKPVEQAPTQAVPEAPAPEPAPAPERAPELPVAPGPSIARQITSEPESMDEPPAPEPPVPAPAAPAPAEAPITAPEPAPVGQDQPVEAKSEPTVVVVATPGNAPELYQTPSQDISAPISRPFTPPPPRTVSPTPPRAVSPAPSRTVSPTPPRSVTPPPRATTPSSYPAVSRSVVDSPKTLSPRASRESLASSVVSRQTPDDSRASAQDLLKPVQTSRSLSLKPSIENVHQELSPIPEDPRSALEEKGPSFTQSRPASGVFPPPMRSGISSASDGTTPRAGTTVYGTQEYSAPAAYEDKGKGREQNGSVYSQSAAPAYSSTDGYFAGATPMPVPQISNNPSYYSEDPFRDPDPVPEPAHEDSYYVVGMPEPQNTTSDLLNQRASVEPSLPTPATVPHLPLPPLDQVTSRTLRNVPSDYTLAARSSKAPSVLQGHETDETRPLLSRPKNAQEGINSAWDAPQHTLETRGWTMYKLPDTLYFYHPDMRIVTDIDLRNPRRLAAVTAYLDKRMPTEFAIPSQGCEIWLRNQGVGKDDFVPLKFWINHSTRSLGYEENPSGSYADDELDRAYRYWGYVEHHPAHAPLPEGAYSEALDFVEWSYTGQTSADRTLKSQRRSPPPPFTQQECKHLLDLLRSTTDFNSAVQSAVQARIVARVHRRILYRKQQMERPEKPLPRDIVPEFNGHTYRGPVRRTCTDFVIAFLCLGIPFFFANRRGYHGIDEESGVAKHGGPLLVLGASVCLVAAIILSASVTFLALPGLDNIARTAAFVAILGSTGSLASSVVALFRHQAELRRMHHIREGFYAPVSTQQSYSIIMSLPAVFLAWSIVAFVTGLVLYAFRGVVIINSSNWVRFSQYTKWTTVGVLGFSAGVLTTSAIFARR